MKLLSAINYFFPFCVKMKRRHKLNILASSSLLLSLCTARLLQMASGINFQSFLSIHTESKISPNLRNIISSETEKKNRKSVVEVLRLRQSYMPVNFHLCAISGNKFFSSANGELVFPRIHLKPPIVSFTLWCTANFRGSFIISCCRCPSSSKFMCVSTQVLRTVVVHY